MARGYGRNKKWATIIAYDPGITTGWAVLCINKNELLSGQPLRRLIQHSACGEIKGSFRKQCSEILYLAEMWPGCVLVAEDFILRQFSKNRDLLSPVRINATIEYNFHGKVFLQQPSLAKSTISDESLRAHKMWHASSPHARDASRHAIVFARRLMANSQLRFDSGLFANEEDPSNQQGED